jgi:Histidine kinase-, DNA gyrase B-, and HSP90-like ATPase
VASLGLELRQAFMAAAFPAWAPATSRSSVVGAGVVSAPGAEGFRAQRHAEDRHVVDLPTAGGLVKAVIELNGIAVRSPRQIEVELHYDDRQVRLRVRDDGKGIDPRFLNDQGREGHFGLQGMRERAKPMGGKLTVWSALNSGAEIELSIPASRAYAASVVARRSWFAERLSGKITKSEL